MGDWLDKTISVVNIGSDYENGLDVKLYGSSVFSLRNQCEVTIIPSGHCWIDIRLYAKLPGLEKATVVITDHAGKVYRVNVEAFSVGH